MATSSVSVLAPNGRRQTVRCNPNITILQIIEEVCKKQGYKAEEYDAKHHNLILDTTNTFRFSGLPNNAQLELVPASRARAESEVILAVILEDGSRVMGNFLPDDTLQKILDTLCPNEASLDQNPVVIYTRREIFGSDLQKTTLRSLGLRGGRAMLRLMHKSPEELRTQANVSAPLPVKPVEEKPFRRVLKTDDIPSTTPQNVEDKDMKDIQKPEKTQPRKDVDFLKLAREKRKLNENRAEVSENNDPKLPKTVSESEQMSVPVTQLEPMEVDSSQDVVIAEQYEPPIEDNLLFLGERHAMLFSLETARNVPAEELPDEFFDLTIDDAKKIIRDIKKSQNEMYNGPLMTSALRNLEESKKQLRRLNMYKAAIIRVQFPSRVVLQGTFKPTEAIRDVVEFVREYLEDKSTMFHLYTTPPKCILSKDERLIEAGCVPGALLHLGTFNGTEVSLRADLSDKITTNSAASLAASRVRQRNTRSISEDSESENVVINVDLNAPGTSAQSEAYERKIISSTEKVPKWFKPNK